MTYQELGGSEGWSAALEQFFGSIDKDGDGQIETAEALQYIDANFDSPDIRQDVRTAAQQMSTNLDGSDSDLTISKEEVETHLRKLLKVSFPHTRFRYKNITSISFFCAQQYVSLTECAGAGEQGHRMGETLGADAAVRKGVQGELHYGELRDLTAALPRPVVKSSAQGP